MQTRRMSRISFANPPNVYHIPGYSQVVVVEEARKALYVSGQVALDRDGKLVGKGDMEAQTRQAFENLSEILKWAGASLDNLVRINIYTTKPDQFDVVRRVRARYVSKDRPPASTLLAVAGLAQPDLLIEVEAVAVY